MPHGVSTSNVIGRRGVSNKPAWMVDGGIVLGKVPSAEEEIQNDTKNVSNNNNGSNNDKMTLKKMMDRKLRPKQLHVRSPCS